MYQESDFDAMRDRISALLKSQACLDIKFKLANITIQRYQYSYTGHSIKDKQVGLIFGKGNHYDNIANVLSFDDPDVNDATIVHECTHVLINATHKGAKIRRGAHELAAYLAETLWSLHSKSDVMVDVDGMVIKMRRMAKEVIEFNKKNKSGFYTVDTGDQQFCEAIMKNSQNGTPVDIVEVQTGIDDGPLAVVEIKGPIVRIPGPGQLVVKDEKNKELTLDMKPKTDYKLNDQPAQFADLKTGMNVRVEYNVMHLKNVARTINGRR